MNEFNENEIIKQSQKNLKSETRQEAKEKLEKEMREAKDKKFAEPIIKYLLKRCAEDEGLAEDVLQEHKTWQKCFDYIYNQAKKHAKENCAIIRYDVVFEWAEDYYHKDDKAEEEKKAKKEEERKASQKKAAESKKAAEKNKSKETVKVSSPVKEKKEKKAKEQPKPKKSGNDIEGQLDMFSLMGM